MDNAEQLDFVSTTDAGEPDHQARHMGRAKYAIVLFGERGEVAGWGYDEEGAIKMLKRSTSWSGVSESPCAWGIAARLPLPWLSRHVPRLSAIILAEAEAVCAKFA
jgi:hypothetical protein